MIGTVIAPLTEIKGTGRFAAPPASAHDRTYRGTYVVLCRDCGDVTSLESGDTVTEAPIEQAGLYRRRHLARHMHALATEGLEANR